MRTEEGKVNEYIFAQLQDGRGREYIEQQLIEQGHEVRFVKEIVAENVKLHYTRRRTQGLFFILAGAVVCFLSCVLTLMHAFSQASFSMVLYGLTSAGIILVFIGFMKIF